MPLPEPYLWRGCDATFPMRVPPVLLLILIGKPMAHAGPRLGNFLARALPIRLIRPGLRSH